MPTNNRQSQLLERGLLHLHQSMKMAMLVQSLNWQPIAVERKDKVGTNTNVSFNRKFSNDKIAGLNYVLKGQCFGIVYSSEVF